MMKYLLLFALAITSISCDQGKKPIFTTKAGAIKGYDPVAYFSVGMAVKGKREHTCEWMEAKWYFASQENKEIFESNPEKYAPQYGGYCAYGVAMGDLFKIEPEAWSIVDGKLYLNYDNQIQKEWEASQADFIIEAEENWPKIKQERGF